MSKGIMVGSFKLDVKTVYDAKGIQNGFFFGNVQYLVFTGFLFEVFGEGRLQ